jgi:hypothetical protein
MAGDSCLVAPPQRETPGMLGRVSTTPALPQMPEGVRGQPTGLSDKYFELTEFDGRVAGSVAGVAPPGDCGHYTTVPPVRLALSLLCGGSLPFLRRNTLEVIRLHHVMKGNILEIIPSPVSHR